MEARGDCDLRADPGGLAAAVLLLVGLALDLGAAFVAAPFLMTAPFLLALAWLSGLLTEDDDMTVCSSDDSAYLGSAATVFLLRDETRRVKRLAARAVADGFLAAGAFLAAGFALALAAALVVLDVFLVLAIMSRES